MELAEKALSMDDSLAPAHAILSAVYRMKGEYPKAIAEGERAMALNPAELDGLKTVMPML